jgi:pimeloyl-ACP methyl ester carboxylesterase
VADAEELERFAIWGQSYGGWVGWVTASAAPDRVLALVTTGSWDPRPDTYQDWVNWTQEDLQVLERDGLPAVIERFEDAQYKIPDAIRAVMLRADPQAMIACQSSELVGDGVRDIDRFPVPVLLIVGDQEDGYGDAAKTAATVPRGQSLTLAGLGHAEACNASASTVLPARAFLDEWFD